MASIRVKTAKSFVEAYASLSPDDLLPLVADDYSHTFAPASLKQLTPKTISDIAAQMTGLRSILHGFHSHIKEIVDSESSNQVVVWASSEAIFHEEVKDSAAPEESWEYKGEYMLIFTMDESGEHITKLIEFVDSKGAERMMGLVMRALRNIKGGDK
jgi:hypothetical protein